MNYKLSENIKDKSIYDVFETATEQVITSCSDFSKARKVMRHLNLGGSFDGWTPSFFLVDVSKILNKNTQK